MKAVRIHEDGGPEVLRYEDVPDPEPGPGEVLIRLRAAWDGLIVAAGIVAMAIVDFISAARNVPVVDPAHVASVSAFCAGYLGCRALAVMVRFRSVAGSR